MQLTYQPIETQHLAQIKEIYDHYIVHTTATFHTEPVTVEELAEGIHPGHARYPSFLIFSDGVMAGYMYSNWYKKRQAYDRTAEVTLYLKPEFTGKGIGSKALSYIETQCKLKGIVVLLAVISGENKGSISLFSRLGYEQCAHFKRVGEKFGRLLDVVVYEKELV